MARMVPSARTASPIQIHFTSGVKYAFERRRLLRIPASENNDRSWRKLLQMATSGCGVFLSRMKVPLRH